MNQINKTQNSGIMMVLLFTAFLFNANAQDQKQWTAKSIPTKSAAFYNPFLDNKLVSGQWLGETYTPSGQELNLTNGAGTFAMFDPKTSDVVFKFKGNTVNGIWDGYIYYQEKSKHGNIFIEGNFKSGLPNGKVICRLENGNYFAGTFQFGKSFDKISLTRNHETKSIYCNGFDFMQFIKNDSSQLDKCKREITLDDPLYGAAIMISNIASVCDKHVSIDNFLECMKLSNSEAFVKNPEFNQLAADAIKSVVSNPSWKDLPFEKIQDQFKQYLALNHAENLSRSDEFISFLGCIIGQSK